MSYCILIPTINRKDLLVKALDWYVTNLPNVEIIVLDNGKQGIVSGAPNLRIFEPKTPKGVAASWNWLIHRAIHRGHTNFLVLNDDVILMKKQNEINLIIERWDEETFHRPRPFYNWSAFILSKHIFQKVGGFDENFKRCFFEDNDYEYRMQLAGIKIRYEDALNPEVFLNSQTILKDPLLGGYIENKDYYIKKWGGIPSEEKFKKPFTKNED